MKPAAPQQVLAERHFPVRVRMAVPARGIGSQFSIMCAWLDRHAGRAGISRARKPAPGLEMARCSMSSIRKSRRRSLIACAFIFSREAPAAAAS
jgi:hypothetical protein